MILMREQQRRNQLRKQLNNQNPAMPGSLFAESGKNLVSEFSTFAKLSITW